MGCTNVDRTPDGAAPGRANICVVWLPFTCATTSFGQAGRCYCVNVSIRRAPRRWAPAQDNFAEAKFLLTERIVLVALQLVPYREIVYKSFTGRGDQQRQLQSPAREPERHRRSVPRQARRMGINATQFAGSASFFIGGHFLCLGPFESGILQRTM